MSNQGVDALVAAGLRELADWIDGFSYKSIGSVCPSCGHGPIYQRHVGFIIGGHNQQSCPCRLIRQSGKSHECGCEWTHG